MEEVRAARSSGMCGEECRLALVLPLLYLAVSLTCTAALATGCSGAGQQDVLLGAFRSSSSGGSGDDNASGKRAETRAAGARPRGPRARGVRFGVPGRISSRIRLRSAMRPTPSDGLRNWYVSRDRADRERLLRTFRLAPQTKAMSLNFMGQVRLPQATVGARARRSFTPPALQARPVPFAAGLVPGSGSAPFTLVEARLDAPVACQMSSRIAPAARQKLGS